MTFELQLELQLGFQLFMANSDSDRVDMKIRGTELQLELQLTLHLLMANSVSFGDGGEKLKSELQLELQLYTATFLRQLVFLPR